MKILQINKFFYRRRGAEVYMLDLIDLLEKHNHEVAVFAMNHPQNFNSEYKDQFADYIELEAPHKLTTQEKLTAATRIIWNKNAQHKLTQLLKRFKPDVAHIHNIYHQLSPSILPILKKHNIPIVQTLHDYKLVAPNYNLLTNNAIDESSLGGKYYNTLLKKSMKNSYSASALAAVEMYAHKWLQVYEKNVDCFISPSQFLKNKVLSTGIKLKRIEVLPNFIDTTQIKPQYSHKAYILYVGGLYKEKGVDLLIDSLAKIEYSLPLRIVGEGPERKALELQAGNQNVTFYGHLEKSALIAQLQNALAVVVPSRWYENYPFAVLEAFAAGKPVVAANIGGLPEMVIPGQTGWLFEPDDTEDLSALLTTISSNPSAAVVMGHSARKWVEENAAPEQHYQHLLQLYSEYVTQKTPN